MKRIICLFSLVLYASTGLAQDGGWKTQVSGTSEWLLDVQFVDARHGWAAGDGGTILKSADGGLSWETLSVPFNNTINSIRFLDTSTGWVGGNGTGILYRTTDGGGSWVRQDSGNSITDMAFVSPDVGWAITFAGIVLKTTNGGADWTPQTVPTPYVYFTSVHFVDADRGFICGKYPGTLLKTVDGGENWVEITDGGLNPDDDYNGMFFLDGNTGWLTGYHYDITAGWGTIKKTTDGGSTWIEQYSYTENEFMSIAFTDSNNGYAVGSQGYMMESTDGGATWAVLNPGTVNLLSRVFVRPGEAGWIVGVGGVILRKIFGGPSVEYPLAVTGDWNMIAIPVVPGESNPDSLFPQALSNLFYFQDGYKSRDTVRNGEGYWMKFSGTDTIKIAGEPLDSLTIPLNAGWNLIGGIGVDVEVGTIVKSPPEAVLSSFFKFEPVTGYVPSTVVEGGKGYWVKTSQSAQLTLYARLEGRTIPKSHFLDPTELVADELPPPGPGTPRPGPEITDSRTPVSYGLNQNYPNPFNPTTTLSFELPVAGSVSLTVYDPLGREVGRLISGDIYAAGAHEVEWYPGIQPGREIASGVYYYRLLVTSTTGVLFSDTKRMMYLK